MKRRGYRVIRHENRSYRFALHEVVYNSDGRLHSVSEEPLTLTGMSIQEIMDILELALDQIDRPAVDFDLFPEIELQEKVS